LTDQTDVFDLPAPPTGPAADVPAHEANRYVAYVAWCQTRDGACAWVWIKDHALGLLKAGTTRISAKTLVEDCRQELKVEINNTYTAWIADDLVRWDLIRGCSTSSNGGDAGRRSKWTSQRFRCPGSRR